MTIRANHETFTDPNLDIIGDSNVVKGASCKVTGDFNRVRGNRCTANGDSNIVDGNFSQVQGNYNVLSGRDSHVKGNHNKLAGCSCSASGNHNRLTGNNSHAYGSHNTLKGFHCFAEGRFNVVEHHAGSRSAEDDSVLENPDRMDTSLSSTDYDNNEILSLSPYREREAERASLLNDVVHAVNDVLRGEEQSREDVANIPSSLDTQSPVNRQDLHRSFTSRAVEEQIEARRRGRHAGDQSLPRYQNTSSLLQRLRGEDRAASVPAAPSACPERICPAPEEVQHDRVAPPGGSICVICQENTPVCVALPCLHMSYCVACARALFCHAEECKSPEKGRGTVQCAKCRKAVKAISRVYQE